MVKQLVHIFTSFHFRNLILNAMIPEKVISLPGMVEHNVYEYFLEHDSLEIKQAKPSSNGVGGLPPAAKRILSDNVAPHLSTLTAVFPVNACCRKTATTMNNPASAGHLLISDDGVFLNNVLHQSRMKEWRNISEKKLVDANIFERGQNDLLKHLSERRMNVAEGLLARFGRPRTLNC